VCVSVCVCACVCVCVCVWADSWPWTVCVVQPSDRRIYTLGMVAGAGGHYPSSAAAPASSNTHDCMPARPHAQACMPARVATRGCVSSNTHDCRHTRPHVQACMPARVAACSRPPHLFSLSRTSMVRSRWAVRSASCAQPLRHGWERSVQPWVHAYACNINAVHGSPVTPQPAPCREPHHREGVWEGSHRLLVATGEGCGGLRPPPVESCGLAQGTQRVCVQRGREAEGRHAPLSCWLAAGHLEGALHWVTAKPAHTRAATAAAGPQQGFWTAQQRGRSTAHSAAQHSAALHCTALHCTAQHSKAAALHCCTTLRPSPPAARSRRP